MNLKNLPIDTLIDLRIDAKNAEDQAIASRRNIDKEISARLKDRDEGTVSTQISNTKVTVTYGMTRKVDTDALTLSWPDMSENAQRCFRWKAELAKKEFDAVKELSATTLAEVSKFVTTAPSTPQVKVEPIDTTTKE